MPDRNHGRFMADAPIERIFQKVAGRRLTNTERRYFRLKPVRSCATKLFLVKNLPNGASDWSCC